MEYWRWGRVVASTIATVATLFAAFVPLVCFSQAGVTYYYTDPQGTVLAMADASGQILSESNATPFGRQIGEDSAPGPGYTGHVEDPDTGFIYMQHRYYDPAVGRFLSIDAVAPKAGNLDYTNRFSYVGNNPITRIDPTGDYICTGSKSNCKQIENALGDVKKASSALPAGNDGKKLLDGIVAFYGESGTRNGVNVGFGHADGNNAVTDSKGRGKETNITFNLSNIRMTGGNAGTSPRIELAAAVAHEGQHGVDGQLFGRPQNNGEWDVQERNSFLTQSYVNEGFNSTSPYGLWVRGWQETPITNGLRESAAQYNADWTVYGNASGP